MRSAVLVPDESMKSLAFCDEYVDARPKLSRRCGSCRASQLRRPMRSARAEARVRVVAGRDAPDCRRPRSARRGSHRPDWPPAAACVFGTVNEQSPCASETQSAQPAPVPATPSGRVPLGPAPLPVFRSSTTPSSGVTPVMPVRSDPTFTVITDGGGTREPGDRQDRRHRASAVRRFFFSVLSVAVGQWVSSSWPSSMPSARRGGRSVGAVVDPPGVGIGRSGVSVGAGVGVADHPLVRCRSVRRGRSAVRGRRGLRRLGRRRCRRRVGECGRGHAAERRVPPRSPSRCRRRYQRCRIVSLRPTARDSCAGSARVHRRNPNACRNAALVTHDPSLALRSHRNRCQMQHCPMDSVSMCGRGIVPPRRWARLPLSQRYRCAHESGQVATHGKRFGIGRSLRALSAEDSCRAPT